MEAEAGENSLVLRLSEYFEIGNALPGSVGDHMGKKRSEKTPGSLCGIDSHTFDEVSGQTSPSSDGTIFPKDTKIILNGLQTESISRKKSLDLPPETRRSHWDSLNVSYVSFCLHLLASFPILPVPPAVEQRYKCNKSL